MTTASAAQPISDAAPADRLPVRTFFTVFKGGSLRSPPRRGPKAAGMRPLRVRPGARTATRHGEQTPVMPARGVILAPDYPAHGHRV